MSLPPKSARLSSASPAKARYDSVFLGYGRSAVPFLLFFWLLSLVNVFPADSPQCSAALSRASELRLSSDSYWHTLLHYKRASGGAFESRVDDPRFFLAPNGKTDPQAELAATIRAFFSPLEPGVRHPSVAFPGRLKWLRDRLGLTADDLPYDGEAEYAAFKARINPGRVFLVFPAGYMNSPASMFGHTFLLVEEAGGSRLLANSVNYAAITEDTFGPKFAFKGLFGLYRGYYSFLPYYQKIREYGDMEMRDIWEYELLFTPEEIDRLIRHIVEMEDIYSDYFFASENCSYNLLFLIEAARPETRITDAFGPAVEPIDTIKAVRRLGLASEPFYRPSLYSRVQFLSRGLSDEENAYVHGVCRGTVVPADFPGTDPSRERRVRLLELSMDYLKQLAIDGSLTEAEYRKRFFSLISARRGLGVQDTLGELAAPAPPHASHGSRRITSSYGWDSGRPVAEFAFRLTAHEVMDPDEGYTPNSQIVFGKATARWDFSRGEGIIRSFDVIDLLSLPSSDGYFFSACYRLLTGFAFAEAADGAAVPAYRLKGASGLSARPADWLHLYALVGPDAFFGPEYRYGTDLLVGGEAGCIFGMGRWKSWIYGEWQWAPADTDRTRIIAGARNRVTLGQNFALLGEYRFFVDSGEAEHEALLAASLYF